MFAKAINELYFHWLKNHPISEPIRNCTTLIFSSFHTGDSKTSCHVLSKILNLAEIAKAPSSISNFNERTWIWQLSRLFAPIVKSAPWNINSKCFSEISFLCRRLLNPFTCKVSFISWQEALSSFPLKSSINLSSSHVIAITAEIATRLCTRVSNLVKFSAAEVGNFKSKFAIWFSNSPRNWLLRKLVPNFPTKLATPRGKVMWNQL